MHLSMALSRGRRAARARMLETGVVKYVSGKGAQDEETGEKPDVFTTRFTSVCRVSDGRESGQFVESEAGGKQVSAPTPHLHFPVTASTLTIREDDLVDVSGSAEVDGRTYRVLAVPAKSQATALRLPVREV